MPSAVGLLVAVHTQVRQTLPAAQVQAYSEASPLLQVQIQGKQESKSMKRLDKHSHLQG